MHLLTRLFVLTLIIFMVGCSPSSIMQNRDKRYLSARSTPPLRIPPGVSTIAFHEEYPVPNRSYSDAQKEVSLVPPGLYN